jgi:hypothetical protein
MKLLLVLLGYVTLTACQEEIPLHNRISHYPGMLQSRNIEQVSRICTPQGLDKVLEWTDSLRNEKLILFWTDNISEATYTYTHPDDSTFRLMLSDRSGLTHDSGEIVIRIQNGKALIDDYMGGYTIQQ